MNARVLGLLRENALFLTVLVVLVGGFLFLRTKGTQLGSTDEFETLISGGQPVVVEFYSNT
jgi:hypothetical protein